MPSDRSSVYQHALTDGRFSRRVAKVRDHRKLTQEQLGNAAGLTRDAILRIEHGNRRTSVGEALAIARALDVPLEDMLSDGELVLRTETRLD